MHKSHDNELSNFENWRTIFFVPPKWSVAVSCHLSSDRNTCGLLQKPTNNSVTFKSSFLTIMSSSNAETSADSFINKPIMQSPFNSPHSLGQFLPLLHNNLLTSSQTNPQFSHLLTPVPFTYHFSSFDTVQIKQILAVKKNRADFF